MQEHNSDSIDMEAVYQDYADFIYRFPLLYSSAFFTIFSAKNGFDG